MATTPESIADERGIRNRGLPAKVRMVDPRQAAELEAARLRALPPETFRRPDGRAPELKDFQAFSSRYGEMAREGHDWRFAEPGGQTYNLPHTGIGSRSAAQAWADIVGHHLVGEDMPDSSSEGTPTREARGTERGARLTPPPLVQAEPPYSPPPLVQAERPYSAPPLLQAAANYSPPPLIEAEPARYRIFLAPWPRSNSIDDDERGIKAHSRTLNRSPRNAPVSRPDSGQKNKPSSHAGTDDEITKRISGYRDIDPPPRKAADKLKPVHNITTEHQEKVRDVVNSAIHAAQRELKSVAGANDILTTAQVTIARLRDSNISDAADNLVYRDADHYLAARTQEFKVRAAMMLYKIRNELVPGSMSIDEAQKIAIAPWSTETNRWAVGPLGANQLYENWKLRQFAQEAKGGPVAERSSAAGGTEWELLGMVDFERYDAQEPSAAPHLLVDLPGKGDRFASNPEAPAYLREEAKRIVQKMDRDAKFTK